MSEITAIAHPGIGADALRTALHLLGERDHASILVRKARGFVATTGATFTVTRKSLDAAILGFRSEGRRITVKPIVVVEVTDWSVFDVPAYQRNKARPSGLDD